MHQACLRACVFLLADMAKPNDSERLCLELTLRRNLADGQEKRVSQDLLKMRASFLFIFGKNYFEVP